MLMVTMISDVYWLWLRP